MSVSNSQDINLSINAMEFQRFLNRANEIKDLNLHIIPIKARKKTPDVFENWNTVRINPDSALARINELHSNVGLVAHETDENHKRGLCFIDVDLIDGKFPIPKDKIDELIAMGTLTIRTKSGGLQFYFINNITNYLRTKGYSTNPKYTVEGSTQDCGELRTNVAYVLAPGSFVPLDYEGGKKGSISGATGLYSIFADNPIKELNENNLPKWIMISHDKLISGKVTDTKIEDAFVGKTKEAIDVQIGFDPTTIKPIDFKSGEDLTNEKGLTLTQIMENDKEFSEILTVVGEKGTRSERDWFICRRMRAMGFDPNQIARALISYRYYKKAEGASNRAYINYISLTIRNAFTHEITTYDPHQSWYASFNVSDINRTSIEGLPEELPDVKYIVLQAPPRTGKTHWSVQQLIKAGTGVYTTNKHEIIRHAISIFERSTDKKTAVYLVGKDRACNCSTNRGECGTCSKRPHIHPGFDDKGHLRSDVLTVAKLRNVSNDLLSQHRVLTPEKLMDNESICPYFVLLLAEYESDFCFTIPYFLTSDREIKRVKRSNRNLLVIDEDPVVTSFYPQEYDIASYSYGRGSKNFTNIIGKKMSIIETIEKKISEQKRKKQVDKEILRLCGIIHQLNDRMDTVVDSTTVEGKRAFDDWIKTFDISNDYDIVMKRDIEKRLKQFEQDMREEDHEIEIFPIFAPIVYVADKPFTWIGGNQGKTLYFIADRQVLYIPPDFYKKVLIIGATQSELYIQDICEDAKDSKVITIDKFKYAENFLLMLLKGATRKEESRMLYSLMFRFAHENHNSNLISPALVLTSSKEKQQKLQNMMQSKCGVSTDQGESEQISMWLHTNMNIFYSNSTLSRGLDIPQYSTLFVDSTKFAIPYFTSLLEHSQETGNLQMTKRAKAIISKITVDEITNSVLRHSPTVDDPTKMFKKEERIKIVVIRDRDVSSIHDTVKAGMRTIEVNSMENLDLGQKLLTRLPDRFDKTAIPRTLAQNCSEHIVRYYCDILDSKNTSEIKRKTPSECVLKANLVTILESEQAHFPKNNAVSLVDPKIKTIVENHPSLKRGERVSYWALIKFISSRIARKKDLNMVEEHAKKPVEHKFGDLTIDKGKVKRTNNSTVPLENKIRKDITNMVAGELLKDELDDGKKFYRLFSKSIFGNPKDSKGNEVASSG